MEGGNYGGLNLSSVLYTARTDSSSVITMEVYHCPGTTKVPFDQAKRAKYQPLKKGDMFGVSLSVRTNSMSELSTLSRSPLGGGSCLKAFATGLG